jgi:hypothetical protein
LSHLPFVILLGLGVLTSVWTYDPSFISNDGAQYLSMAENLLAGLGFSTSIVFYDPQYALSTTPVPQTVFPPGYPLLIALVSLLGPNAELAMYLVSLASYAFSAVVTYELLTHAGHRYSMRLIFGSAWLGFGFVWVYVFNGLSEFSFTLLTLLSLLCISRSEMSPEKRQRWIVLAGTFAAFGFLTRYAGLFFIASLGGFFLFRFLRERTKPVFYDLMLVAIVPVLAVAATFLRNYLVVGSIHGVPSYPNDKSWLSVLQSFYWSVSGLLGYSVNDWMNARIPEMLLTLFIIALVVLLFARRKQFHYEASSVSRLFARGHVSISAAYVLVSLAMLSYVAATTRSGAITPRYLIPLIPFCLILLAEVTRGVSTTVRGVVSDKRVALITLAAMVVVFLAGQLAVFREEMAKLRQVYHYADISQMLDRPYASDTLRLFLAHTVSAQTPILTNESQALGAAARVPALGLSLSPYSRYMWTSHEVANLVRRYNVPYVIFFPTWFDPALPEHSNQIFFRELQAGHPPPWLRLLFSNERIRLYVVERAHLLE